MRILLLHLPIGPDVPNTQVKESLGLGYVAAALRADGHQVELLDAHLRGLNLKETIHETLTRDFEYLGITAMHLHKDALLATVRAIRAKRKDAVIVAGGYLPSLATEPLLSACPEIDFIVRGEGEVSVRDIFGRIANGQDWRDAPGVAYLSGGTPVINPCPSLVQDLDSLPFPARDALLEAPQYITPIVSASRGCYHRCSFCSVHSFYSLSDGRAPRLRSAASVADELESLIATTGRTRFDFIDDNFIGPGEKGRQHAVSIAEEIMARKLKVNFTMECRADEVDVDVLRVLKEAGLTLVYLGLESGVQRQLDTFNKRIKVEQNKRALEIVREVDLGISSGLIIFDPYTTMAELAENMEFVRETGLEGKVPSGAKIILYHGVPLVDEVRKDGLLVKDGLDLEYKFKDWRVRMMWRAMGVFRFLAGLKRRMLPQRAAAEQAGQEQ